VGIQSLDRTELLALLAAAKAHSTRDWLMILVAFCHGLRASEVVGLQAHDISDGHLIVQRLKGSEKTRQPLLANVEPLLDERQALTEYVRTLQPNQRLFKCCRQTFWRVMQRHAAAAGIAAHKRFPHILKHSIAMQIIQKAGIENTKKYLGHKSGASTLEYLKKSDDEAAAAVRDALAL
jgi:type 1 fimbriae regulatory protein FimB